MTGYKLVVEATTPPQAKVTKLATLKGTEESLVELEPVPDSQEVRQIHLSNSLYDRKSKPYKHVNMYGTGKRHTP